MVYLILPTGIVCELTFHEIRASTELEEEGYRGERIDEVVVVWRTTHHSARRIPAPPSDSVPVTERTRCCSSVLVIASPRTAVAFPPRGEGYALGLASPPRTAVRLRRVVVAVAFPPRGEGYAALVGRLGDVVRRAAWKRTL
jgi:hypothetical protein